MYSFVDAAVVRVAALPSGVDVPPWPDLTGTTSEHVARWRCWLQQVWACGVVAAAVQDTKDLRSAIRAYNHSDTYVQHVLDQAARYTTPPPPADPAGTPLAPEAATVADPSGTGGRVTPRTATIYQTVQAAGLTRTASCFGQRPELPSSDHPTGRACDFYFNPEIPPRSPKAGGWPTGSLPTPAPTE
ncbi:MAG: hypothetical protein ACRDUV_17575 [Pseudonocardiaceae bacterium]